MGRRISKEFLHPSILEGVNNKIGNLDSLETDAKGNMVQAINELVEKLDNSAEIENGKELIANAVGEPLTAEESFDEMSNDINSLLSTFKTNMMNNGVTVESGDKFKSLIDKIATMVEEGSNKGIQFASGTCNVTTNVGGSTTITTNLDFVPTYIFCYALVRRYRGQNNDVDGSLPNLYISNISRMPSTSGYPVSVSNITANDFRVSGGVYNSVEEYKTSVNVTKWYAIGIGEEDTTLRDSLADILENKGVDVTEEDDMASLITKVDNISGGLDIISATELPESGRENQICVITDNPEGSFLITNMESDTNSNGFLVYNTNNTSITSISITNGNVTQNYRIPYVKQGTQYLATYIWSNGVWNVMTNANLILLENGAFKNTDISGGFNTGNYHTLTSSYLNIKTDTNDVYYTRASFKNQIDFTYYNTLKITLKSSNSTSLPLRLYSGSACTSSRPSGQAGSNAVTVNATSSKQTLTLDITSWKGLGCLNLEAGHEEYVAGIYVYYIELY